MCSHALFLYFVVIVKPWPWSGWDRQSVQVNVGGGMTINGREYLCFFIAKGLFKLLKKRPA